MSSTYSSSNRDIHTRLVRPPSPFVAPRPTSYLSYKGLLSRLIAVALLIPTLPLLPLLMLLVRLSSPGPAIYRQVRVGRNGKLFTMYKLRTMRNDAERDTGPIWTLPSDPRVTRLGWYLRILHLDEIPQLFNMLRGDMALVGPRPERPEITRDLERRLDGYDARHAVLPGITGLAQVLLPADTDLDSVRRKLAIDLEYIEHADLLLDLEIFFCTCLRLMGLRFRMARRILDRRRNTWGTDAWLDRIHVLPRPPHEKQSIRAMTRLHPK